MKNVELKYTGFQNKHYCFKDVLDNNVQFSGARADLIYDFDLREETNINVWFQVFYFSTYDGDNESKIISDLLFLPNDIAQ
ncbi:MAG: hypothetical protein MUQ75_08385 [Crocinitomicaceae bacterium]|jgi:hypothetical protein|nr:hypothetical protein [Crocinitomicaceae bacterium]|tara:strand:- start:182 stop:424 length:243 start_codon:yes stop_codon:yes gene_type:complete